MDWQYRRTDLPVLLLHNLDRAWSAEDIASTRQYVAELKAALQKEGHPVTEQCVWDSDLDRTLAPYRADQHVVFNWCEEIPGVPRSDALVAEFLESRGFAFTGSSPSVLSLSWDKPRVKALLDGCGLPTPQWQLCESDDPGSWDYFPAIVKPAREHCSTGLTREAVVLDPDQLSNRLRFVLDELQQPALVEDFIDGREFHISLLGNGRIRMLPPAEMDFAAFDSPQDRLCTYDSKFTPGSAHYENITLRLPAALNQAEYHRLEQTAIRAFQIVGCRDYARVDIRLRNDRFYVLDINPNADISSDTSLVSAAETAGYSYGALCSLLVNFAAARHPRFVST
jgi:D-alanine-D-alanine ligase